MKLLGVTLSWYINHAYIKSFVIRERPLTQDPNGTSLAVLSFQDTIIELAVEGDDFCIREFQEIWHIKVHQETILYIFRHVMNFVNVRSCSTTELHLNDYFMEIGAQYLEVHL